MAAEQNRPARARPEVARPETQELNVDAGLGILFGTPGRKDDSFIPPLRYARNEGMIKPQDAKEIGFEKLLCLCDRECFSQPPTGNSGIVHEHIYLAGATHDALHCLVH